MTYFEFFDTEASENICTCLTFVPQRVIYIGDNAKVMKRHIENYTRVFADRGHQIEFLFKTVSKSNLDQAVTVLSELVETYDDCVFDITGGEEILNVALGIVCARYTDRDIQIHRVNLRNNKVYDCDKDGVTVYQDPPMLTVEENIRIYGGDVVYGDILGEKTYQWDMTPDFVQDIHRMWTVCKGNVRLWNVQIGIFEAIEKVGTVSDDGLTSVACRAALDYYLTRHKAKYKTAKGIIQYLVENGLLTCFDDTDSSTVKIAYKNLQVKRCLTKAGQVLEMKVYATARELVDSDGQPVYDDALNGVVIDWDGQLHDEQTQDTCDTENEIDVLLMHDVIPVFISCKNGIVTADELYKLNTVAERFGGRYAKKVLIATAISLIGEAGNYLRQRAKDMHICLVENIQEMDDAALAKKLKNLWSN